LLKSIRDSVEVEVGHFKQKDMGVEVLTKCPFSPGFLTWQNILVASYYHISDLFDIAALSNLCNKRCLPL